MSTTLHPTTAEYILFSGSHGIFSRVDHVLGHKTSLNKFKLIESYKAYSLAIIE